MASELQLILGVALAAIVIILVTPVIAHGLWRLYWLLGVYHPTESHLEQQSGVEPDEYYTETWIEKWELTYIINFVSTIPTLLLVLVYGIVVLDMDLSFPAIFGAGVVIVAVNSALRIGSLTTLPWGNNQPTSSELVSFGYSFFTSLWVLSALGAVIAILNQEVATALTAGTESNFGSLQTGAIWAGVYVVSVMGIPFVTEYYLAKRGLDREVMNMKKIAGEPADA
jgi:hypothetical protein